MNYYTIINNAKTNHLNTSIAIEFVTSSTHKQTDLELLIDELKSIQTIKATQLLKLIQQNEKYITILHSDTQTHIQALHTPRVSKSSSATISNLDQLQFEQSQAISKATSISTIQTENDYVIEDPFQESRQTSRSTSPLMQMQSSSQTSGGQPTTTQNVPQASGQSSRRVNFTQPTNAAITQQLRTDVPSIDAITALFQSTLSSAIHTKPSNIKVYTIEEINDMPTRDFAHTLEQQYLMAPKLSERDIYQIRFALAMYKDRSNLSDDTYHDVISQIVLFYHVLIYGWTVASQMCTQIIIKPKLNGMPVDLKTLRAHNSSTTATRTPRAPSRRRQGRSPYRSSSNRRRPTSISRRISRTRYQSGRQTRQPSRRRNN
jgi:hypothetical protein